MRPKIVRGFAWLQIEVSPCGQSPTGKRWEAAIDTGASKTHVGGQVWRGGGLTDQGLRERVVYANGKNEKRKAFDCDLHLYDAHGGQHTVPDLKVVGGEPKSATGLIGTNVLFKGVLTLDGPGGACVLCFP